MKVVELVGTADNADALNATDLENLSQVGALIVQAASTQDDTLITITDPSGAPVVRGQALALRANAEIRSESDPSYDVAVLTGGKVVIDINVQTAATWRLRVVFLDAEELGLT